MTRILKVMTENFFWEKMPNKMTLAHLKHPILTFLAITLDLYKLPAIYAYRWKAGCLSMIDLLYLTTFRR